MRIGHGYDVHRLVEGRKLILGGVKIDYHLGLLGHADADVFALYLRHQRIILLSGVIGRISVSRSGHIGTQHFIQEQIAVHVL